MDGLDEQPVLDTLTDRELEVLRLMVEGLSNREIALEFVITLGTVQWYSKQIYGKLGVHSRKEAVTKATDLGLLVAPPDKSTDHPRLSRHTLPAPVTAFIGRERELLEIKNHLEMARLLTLTGPGGIGKTRLALESASQQLEAFADGVYYVSLAPLLSANAIVPTLAESLDLSFSPVEEPKTQLLTYLRDKQLLLVMDNFENLLDGAPLLTEILEVAPALRIIVTSREKLNLHSETVFNTPGLDFPASAESEVAQDYSSVTLFVQSAQRAKADFEPMVDDLRNIARICRLVEGMPLALELAGAWVGTLTCRDIVVEIERGLDILEGELRDMPARMRSIRAVFDHSWDLTPQDQREVYKRLSIFRGGFTREAAEYVAHASLKSLSSLVNKSLLWRRASGRYEMHALLRQYAEEKLLEVPGAEEETRDLHSTFYTEFLELRLAGVLGDRQLEALQEIDEEIDNVRAAWHWAVTQSGPETLDRQGRTLFMFYETRSWYHEGLEVFASAVEAKAGSSQIEEQKAIIGQLLEYEAHFRIRLGDFGKANVLLKESASLLGELADRDELADVLTRLAASEFYLGNYEEAERLLHDCLPMRKESGKQWELAWSLFWFGRVSYALGRYEEAGKYLQDAIAIHRQIGELMNRTDALIMLGLVTSKQGKHDEAIRLVKEALAIAKEIVSPFRTTWARLSLGKVELARDNFQEARLNFHAALQSAIDILSVRLQLDSLVGIGEVLMHEGDTERATQLLFLIHDHPSSEAETRLQAESLLGELGFGQAVSTRDTEAEGMAHALNDAIASVFSQSQFSQLPPREEHLGRRSQTEP